MNTPDSNSDIAPAAPGTVDSPLKPEPGLTVWECLARFVIVVIGVIGGFIAALVIAFSAGWINIGC